MLLSMLLQHQVCCWPLLLLTPHSKVAQYATAAPGVLLAPVATYTL